MEGDCSVMLLLNILWSWTPTGPLGVRNGFGSRDGGAGPDVSLNLPFQT